MADSVPVDPSLIDELNESSNPSPEELLDQAEEEAAETGYSVEAIFTVLN